MDYVILGKKIYLDKSKDSSPAVVFVEKRAQTKPHTEKEIINTLIDWNYSYKKEHGHSPGAHALIKQACQIIRSHGKGINKYKVRDYVHSVWFEDEDCQEKLIKEISDIL